MNVFEFLASHPQAAVREFADVILLDQEHRWSAGDGVRVEEYLERIPQIAEELPLVVELAVHEFQCQMKHGDSPLLEQFVDRFPELRTELLKRLRHASDAQRFGTTFNGEKHSTNASRSPAELAERQQSPSPEPTPASVGRYRVEHILGRGGFGRVYLAHDDDLKRSVAVKVPHRHRIRTREDMESYLAEARIVARLEHPHIVPIYDFGRTEDGLCYFVSKHIAGTPLRDLMAQRRLSTTDSVQLVAKVAEALHYAHNQGLVHRDVKPSNILVDAAGEPYVTDFGLAIEDSPEAEAGEICGTPAYMSPEQARGEGHIVDGRSDVFSLGVVFYELLTNVRPFRAKTVEQLLRQIETHEPRPPRQRNDAIPKPLERICLKALSKCASNRYTTASDMADELRGWCVDVDSGTQATGPEPSSGTTHAAIPVIPKGIRSFDASDASFFLRLMQGPYDREGLPELLRFWKTAAEERDCDRTFRVGVVYGPSGCGKSSALKAGLLPLLDEDVASVYIECTALGTESCVLKAIRKRFSHFDESDELVDVLARLRRGEGLGPRQKVFLVLDQFEQWLHGRADYGDSKLLRALRQCNGGRVQAVVMVRDDFWMPIMRFMRELDIPMVQRQNSAAVDLFDVRHARKVLTEFGRAYDCLPKVTEQGTPEQERFLDEAVMHIAEDGLVIPVRLSLFAEMVKSRAWVPSTLQDVGGAEGIGLRFMEESISGPHAPPERRLHQKAIRSILASLLPSRGIELKGAMKSRSELLAASGIENEQYLDEVLQLLDDLHLITPTDPKGAAFDVGDTELCPETGTQYYQLTHDFLVPSVRQWIEQKQRETRRGRAGLLLEERTRDWAPTREKRLLPTALELLSILLFMPRRARTPRQRAMLQRAVIMHGRRVGATVALAVAIVAATFGAMTLQQGILTNEELLGDFLDADAAVVDRLDAFDELTLSDSTVSTAVLAILPLQTDSDVVKYALRRLVNSAESDEIERRELIALIQQLMSEGSSGEIQRQALLAYMELGPASDVLGEVHGRFSEPDSDADHLTDAVVNYISGIKLIELGDRSQILDTVEQLALLLMTERRDPAISDAVVTRLDTVDIDSLFDWMTSASKRRSRGDVNTGVAWLVEYFERTAGDRRDGVLAIIGERFSELTRDLEQVDPDTEYRLEFTAAAACALQEHSSADNPLLSHASFDRLLDKWRTQPRLVELLIDSYTCLYRDTEDAAAEIRNIVAGCRAKIGDDDFSNYDELLSVTIDGLGKLRDREGANELIVIAKIDEMEDFFDYEIRPKAVLALARIGVSLKQDQPEPPQLDEIRVAIANLAQTLDVDTADELTRAVLRADWLLADIWEGAALFRLLLDKDMWPVAMEALHEVIAYDVYEEATTVDRAIRDYVEWHESAADQGHAMSEIDDAFIEFRTVQTATEMGARFEEVQGALTVLQESHPVAATLLEQLESYRTRLLRD